MQFISKKFVETYDPTIEDIYRKDTYVNGNYVPVEVLDTAGTEQFRMMRDMYLKSGDVFVIVYSITNIASFQQVRALHEHIHTVKNAEAGDVPIVVCANKTDLEDLRTVSSNMGEKLAQELKATFIETSAKDVVG
eukprot:Awhi_evm1s6508